MSTRPVQIVQNEHLHTHKGMTAEQEHEERLNATIDRFGTRLPAYYLEISIIFTGLLLVGIYMLVINPVW